MTAILLEKENEDELTVRFGYDPDLVAKIKGIAGRKWRPDSKSWLVPNTVETIQKLLYDSIRHCFGRVE